MRRRATVSVRRGPGLVGTMARTAVIAGTATATATAVSNASMKKAAAQQQAAQQQAMAAQAAEPAAVQAAEPAQSSFDEQLIQIQKLAALKDQGLLTEEEFQAMKRQILGI